MMFAKKQFLMAAAVLLVAALVPAGVGAATKPKAAKPVTVAGVVVAREAARGTLVVASAHGVVNTLRSRAAAKAGTRVVAKATRLADGTYKAGTVARHGNARSARVRAVIVRTAGSRLYLSAGGSVFAVARGRGLASASGGDLPPGTVVTTTLTIDQSNGSVSQSDTQQVGQTSTVSLEGTISALSSGSLVVSVDEGALTTVTIPASLTLPSTIAVGDRVELLTQVAAGVFTLVTIQDDHAAASSGNGTDMSGAGTSSSQEGDQGNVEAEGLVTAVDLSSNPATVTVQGGDNASPITFTVPSGFTVPSLAVGDRVHARGLVAADGTVTLVKLELQHPEGGDSGSQTGTQHSGTHGGDVEAEGTVTALTADSLTVQPGDGGAPVVFAVPAGFDVSGVAAGDTVDAKGSKDATGTVTLTKLEVKSSSMSTGDGSGSGSGSGSGGSDSGSSSSSSGSTSGDGSSTTGSGG